MIYWVHIEAFLRLRLMLCRLKCLNWIILPNWTMRENHIWGLKKKTNCIRISASWQQAPSNHILWPNKNEKKIIDLLFHGSLNYNVPLLVSCRSCSPVPPVYTFTHVCTTWCVQYFSVWDYLGRKALHSNIIYNLFLWGPLRLWNRYSSTQVGG